MKQALTAFARNTVFANIILVLLFLAGWIASSSMIKEIYPEFSLDMITITVEYPGADPEEIEEGISRKVEEAIEEVEGIRQYTTKSKENVGTTVIEVRQDYDVKAVLEKVKTQVEAISTFPEDAERPVIQEFLLKDPVLQLFISGDMSERRIKEWGQRLKEEIRLLPGISQVEIFGARDYEIGIEVSEQKLRQYGLTFSMVADAVKKGSLNLAGGTIRTSGEEIRVRTVGRKYTGEELASIVVLATPEGDIITLDRIADIRDSFSEDPIQAEINAKPALMLIVNKTREEDSITISQQVRTFIEKKQKQLPEGVTLKILYDNTDKLRARLNLLVKNGIMGMIIVFLLLWIFLNARLSLWAGMGIPVSIAGALVILWATGGTVNMVSLFGLIMVLGIVVDDAIIVGESIYVHRKMGKSALQAAVDGVSEVGMPVIAAVATTIVAFVPLLHVGGIMGKFIAILPVVVIACLAVSLVECLFLLPAHLSHLPDPNAVIDRKNSHPVIQKLTSINRITSDGMEWFVEKIYRPFLSRSLRYRYVNLCTAISVLLLTFGLVKGGIIKFEVFPELDGFVITSTVEFPEGTPPEVTRQAVDRIEAAALRLQKTMKTASGDPLIEDHIALVGQTFGGRERPKTGPHYGVVQLVLLDSAQRGIHTKDLIVAWEKETGPVPGIKSLTFTGMKAGPPGDPIEVWLNGHDMEQIIAAGDELMSKLRTYDGVFQIRSDFSQGKKELRLVLKPEARTLGLTVDDLARQIYTGFYGYEALRLQRGRDDIRVRVRYTEDERSRISDLEKVRIRTRTGSEVPLTSVASLKYAQGYSTITRTDGMRRIAISAGVDTNKANANEIFAELSADFFPRLEERYPNVRVALQGEQKKMRESLGSLMVGFPLAILGVFIIIATIFRSYIQPVIILVTIPFGIIGAVVGHLVMGYDLTIMSIFGMVALTGVVVNEAIVLIEKINDNLAEGMPFFPAIINGGARRFRAIFLTTISTVGGLLPLILETDFQARFLIPMALSIAAGVAFSTLLTLIFIPSLFVILNDIRIFAEKLKTGVWPERLEVEPATYRKSESHEKPSGYDSLPAELN